MKNLLILGTVLGTVAAVNATIYTTNWNSGLANGGTVPDNNFSGWSDTRTVSTMPAGMLQGVAVTLDLGSDWTGDLYAYLVNGSGFAVLLNRVGTPASVFGYGAGMMNVTLADDGFNGGGAFNSIHEYGGGSVSGVFNPDGGSLATFLGTGPNGSWSLFIADLSGGGVTTVHSWGLQMDIVAVPELETWIASALAGAFGAFWLNRQIWGKARPEVDSR